MGVCCSRHEKNKDGGSALAHKLETNTKKWKSNRNRLSAWQNSSSPLGGRETNGVGLDICLSPVEFSAGSCYISSFAVSHLITLSAARRRRSPVRLRSWNQSNGPASVSDASRLNGFDPELLRRTDWIRASIFSTGRSDLSLISSSPTCCEDWVRKCRCIDLETVIGNRIRMQNVDWPSYWLIRDKGL